jgi:glucose-6-phosphate isomerase
MPQESLPFAVSLDLALGGPGACPKAAYDGAISQAEEALAWLKDQHKANALELLSVPSRRDDLVAAQAIVESYCKDTSNIAVLGIGGSSLGGQALKALEAAGRKGPRITFHDNPDPQSWQHAMSGFDLKTTRFIVISKSGGTAETLMQALTAADAIENAGGGKYLKYHFAIVTEPKKSPLRDFAQAIGAPVLDHPTGVGGRYSVLTIVGALPALLMGLDVVALREGAQGVLDQALSGSASNVPAAQGAALHHALAGEGRLRETVLWAYADKLATLSGWWRQLWAESLGKNGKGSTPVGAVGPVDQHSQLQLFRDGPGGALFTILAPETRGQGLVTPVERANALGLQYLAGKPMGDLVAAEARATAETLSRNGRPVRQFHLPKIDERSMGALMMHFMLETILMGRLMGVDPFDQPGVEEGKVLARQYLGEQT